MHYAELKCRTHYSFLQGASHPRELVARAAELGLSALAITDRNGVYGIPKAFIASKELADDSAAVGENKVAPPRAKLIVGAELALVDPACAGISWISLLAMNREGYGLMCRLLTASHADQPKGEARLPWVECAALLQAHEGGSRGLIVIPGEELYLDPKRRGILPLLRERFGDRFYLPLSRFLDGHDERRTREALAASRELGVPLVATNDVHYHAADRRRLQDALTAIREVTPLEGIGRKIFSNGERHLKSPEQMTALFPDLPEALENTLRVAERCTFCPSELRYYYPSEWIPAGETAQSYLEKQTWKGAAKIYRESVPDDVKRQLEHELALIEELRFADYFLTIWDVVEFARGRGILCQGRGSAANSAVCYCLGITAVDPVRMKLLFERFLSAERGEPPDIDVDFEHERREEVIQEIYRKYGRDRAGMVAAVITYRSRSARRQIAKALGLDEEAADPEREPLLAELMEEIRGFPRHLSIHSGGFTLSAVPIIETVPIEPARMENRTIVQWDKDDLAALGLLKVDVLSLGMLTAIRKTFDLLQPGEPGSPKRYDPQLALASIPSEDLETYKMIQEADTVGVFQIESRAQMNMLRRLKPAKFYDLVIEVAIVRPGPIVGEMVHPYLRRRRGEESSESLHPKLDDILGRTLGVPLFQEQVMKMAVALAGFTPGEADELRRAINAWKSSGALDRLGHKLMKGLLASGLPQEFVERIFKQIQGFSEYGFPESHAASFALLAYASSYLKRHHPAEFACALINSQPMGFYSNHTLVDDAKRHGVGVRPVDPNRSDYNCTIEEGMLRLGFRVVNGMSEADARAVVSERARGRPFESLLGFLSRTRLKPRVLNHLAMGGAFECFGLEQRRALWEILAHRLLTRPAREQAGEQMSLFGEHDTSERSEENIRAKRGIPSFPSLFSSPAKFASLSPYDSIREDFQSYGLSARGHPMSALRVELAPRLAAVTTAVARAAENRKIFKIAGMIIVRQHPQTAKDTVFAALEDEEGFIDIVVQKHVQDRYNEVFLNETFMIATVRMEREERGDGFSFIAQKFEPLFSGDGHENTLRASSRDFR